MAYHFHRATTMGMPANLAVIPLTQILMPAAAAAVGLGYISRPSPSPRSGSPASLSTASPEPCTGWAAHKRQAQSFADLRVAMPSVATILIAVAALALAMLASTPKAYRRIAVARVSRSRRVLDCVHSLASADSAGSNGDDGHRRRPRRLHSPGYAAGPHDC